MKRLIDPDAVIAPLKEEYKKVKQAFDETNVFQAPNDVALYGALMQELGAVIGMIEDAKTIEAKPVKHGKWKWLSCTYDRVPKEQEYECSECHHKTIVHGDNMPWEKYCPNCGARMDKE